MRYAYVRVSSSEQCLDRQVAEITARYPDIEERNIYSDKASGKDFQRDGYIRLKGVLRKGDELVIKELDRLGRNKELIKSELQSLRESGVKCRILDIPTTLVDFGESEWVGEMVENILVEVLGAIAENERKRIRERQAEGIKQAKARGVKFGKVKYSNEMLREYIDKIERGQMTVEGVCEVVGISRSAMYSRLAKARGREAKITSVAIATKVC